MMPPTDPGGHQAAERTEKLHGTAEEAGKAGSAQASVGLQVNDVVYAAALQACKMLAMALFVAFLLRCEL